MVSDISNHPFLEISPHVSDGGNLIGRDPRKIGDWAGYPGERLVGIKAIRAKCLDCAHTANEVRRCTVISCPLWPLRMGSVPAGYRPQPTEAERRARDDAENDGQWPPEQDGDPTAVA